MYFDQMQTPLGEFTIVLSAAGAVTHLIFAPDMDHRMLAVHARLRLAERAPELVAPVRVELEEYFAGARRLFTVPLAPTGTTFQRQVWNALLDIPYGETNTYASVAARLGNPRAARAVGAANGQNPISVLIPCHRLVGARGQLSGYAGGLKAKRWLLELERGAG